MSIDPGSNYPDDQPPRRRHRPWWIIILAGWLVVALLGVGLIPHLVTFSSNSPAASSSQENETSASKPATTAGHDQPVITMPEPGTIGPLDAPCLKPGSKSQTYWKDPGKIGPWAFGPPASAMDNYTTAVSIRTHLCPSWIYMDDKGYVIHGGDERFAASLAPVLGFDLAPNDPNYGGRWETMVNQTVSSLIHWDDITRVTRSFGPDAISLEMVGKPGSEFPLIKAVPAATTGKDEFARVPATTVDGREIVFYVRLVCMHQLYVANAEDLPPALYALL